MDHKISNNKPKTNFNRNDPVHIPLLRTPLTSC